MDERASDDPLGFYAGWKSYFLASYLLVGVVALESGGHWLYWFAPAIVPLFFVFTAFYVAFSFKLILIWFGMVALVIYAVQGFGGLLEHWRTPRRAWRYALLLAAVVGGEMWLMRVV
jgi:hypothetical protein